MADEDTRIPTSLGRNAVTCVISATPAPVTSAPLRWREAFLVAYDRLALLARVTRGPSMVVAAVTPDARVIESLVVPDRASLVIGRHTQCDLRLVASSVSLRHLVALVRFEGARPVIHLRDLATERPFLTEDDQPNAALTAEGPVYAAIEGYALWFLPSSGLPGAGWPPSADAALRAIQEPRFVDRRPPDPRVAAPRPPPPAHRLDDMRTTVTRLGPPLLLGDGDEPELPWGTLRISDGVRREKRSISAERLERGVLLGRYDRCGLLVRAPDNTLSRVHALILRIGTEVWIVDTASTNGVRRGDTRVRASILADPDHLSLGGGVALDWKRDVHAEA